MLIPTLCLHFLFIIPTSANPIDVTRPLDEILARAPEPTRQSKPHYDGALKVDLGDEAGAICTSKPEHFYSEHWCASIRDPPAKGYKTELDQPCKKPKKHSVEMGYCYVH